MTSTPKISLSFSKKIEKIQLEPSAIRNDVPIKKTVALENIESVEDNVIKTDYIEGEADLVIPLILKDRGKSVKKTSKKTEDLVPSIDEKDLTLEERAVAEILRESRETIEKQPSEVLNDSKTIELEKNKTATFETSEVDLAESASLDNYDEIPIGSFGAAVLRGMGWKKSGGIGKFDKDIVPIDPFIKSRVLGETKVKKATSNSSKESEDLLLKVGAFIYIHSGRKKNSYGKIQYIDADYLIVDLAMGRGTVTEVEANMKLVSKDDYHKSSRVINKHSYDSYKAEEEAKKKKNKSEEEEDISESLSLAVKKTEDNKLFDKLDNLKGKIKYRKMTKEYNKDSKSKDNHDSFSNEVKVEQDLSDHRDRDSKGRKRKKSEDDNNSELNDTYSKSNKNDNENEFKYSKNYDKPKEYRCHKKDKHKSSDKRHNDSLDKYRSENSSNNTHHIPWIQENLRVRIISKGYKKGKYHKEKVIVHSILTPELCECITNDGKILTSINPDWLETVIPKDKPKRVLVVKGKYRLQRGHIIEVDKDNEKAMVQLLSSSEIVKLHYEDICELVT